MNLSKLSDEELAQATIDGDKSAFQSLVERYQRPLFSYLYRFLYQNHDAAEDVLQSVFIKFYQNLKAVDLEKKVKPWIYRIAHNEAANYLRSKSRRKEVMLDSPIWDIIPNGSSGKEQTENENREIIQWALAQLKPKYREVLVLHYYEEKSYGEISQIIDSSVNSVGTLLRRARQQMEKLLAHTRD
jgi:RNA polymerase sigma-70 factor, ECF subfamily